jgi:hypothetical protein
MRWSLNGFRWTEKHNLIKRVIEPFK